MRCWNCGHELGDPGELCPNCGVELPTGKSAAKPARTLCEVCGKAVLVAEADAVEGKMLCPQCGVVRRKEHDQADEKKEKEREMMRSSGIRSRRRADRFEVAQCFVRVAPIGLTAMLLRQDKLRVGPVVDLSRTGLQCISDNKFEKGDIIKVEILAPAFSKALQLRGTVRWAIHEASGQTRMGVEFDSADTKTQAHLEALEKHEALRNAAYLLEEKKSSTATMKKVDGGPPGLPKDF
jgi:hypothetical protein